MTTDNVKWLAVEETASGEQRTLNHSPEPWAPFEMQSDTPTSDVRYEIDHAGDGSVVGCKGLFLEDAKRICACVNACRRLSTEQLTGHILFPIGKLSTTGKPIIYLVPEKKP